MRVRVIREADPAITSMVEEIREANGFADPDNNTAADDKLHEFAAEARMCKDEYEVREMRKAVAATKHGFDNILRKIPSSLGKPRSERMLEGAFNAISREEGNEVGYDTIIASGAHAPILHWMRNTGTVESGELLLIDAGVESTACIPPTSPARSRPTASSPISRRSCTRPCWIPSRPVSRRPSRAPRIRTSIMRACA